MGKLIVLEGLDGSGKTTQINQLIKFFEKKEINFKQIKLPNYDGESSALVKMYLNGEFGSKPGDVNAYAASAFYAVDRYASYKQLWSNDYAEDTVIIADRYTTSNAIHQISKLDESEWSAFSNWLYHFEFDLMGIPKPDLVIFLDMSPEISQRLMSGRYDGDEAKKDIHERDMVYLQKCRDAAFYSAEKSGWYVVKCYEGSEPLSITAIADEIHRIVTETVLGDML